MSSPDNNEGPCGVCGRSREECRENRVSTLPAPQAPVDPRDAEITALRREIANLREIVANETPPRHINAAYMEAHEGPGECVLCGCEPGQRHVYLSHYAEAIANGTG